MIFPQHNCFGGELLFLTLVVVGVETFASLYYILWDCPLDYAVWLLALEGTSVLGFYNPQMLIIGYFWILIVEILLVDFCMLCLGKLYITSQLFLYISS